MKISLIGPMASGKSTIGQCLAKKLKLPFYDTDQLVETKMHRSVSEIFAQMGEAIFRQLETEVLVELFAKSEDCVIATGGGIIKSPQNRQLLKEQTQVFFLDVSIAEQLKRVEGDCSRPILMVANREEKLQDLRRERLSLYQEIAQHTLMVDGLPPEILALQIQKGL